MLLAAQVNRNQFDKPYCNTTYLLHRANDEHSLEIDFESIDFTTPRIALPSSIGNGLSFITKSITSNIGKGYDSAKPLVDYLISLNHQGEVI